MAQKKLGMDNISNPGLLKFLVHDFVHGEEALYQKILTYLRQECPEEVV